MLRFVCSVAVCFIYKAGRKPFSVIMAMEMANLTSGCFMSANIVSGILKPNFNPHFWSMVLAALRNLKKTNISVYGDRFTHPWQMVEPTYLRRVNKCVVLFLDYETCSAETGPEARRMMSAQDLLFGSVRLRGKFKVNAWTSTCRLTTATSFTVRYRGHVGWSQVTSVIRRVVAN